MEENISKRVLLGLNKESFAPIAALLVALVGSVLSLVFSVQSIIGAGELISKYAAGEVLFIIGSAFNIAATAFFAVAVVLSRNDSSRNFLLLFAGAPFALAFLIGMIGGILKSGQYTNVIQILLFVFILVVAGTFAAVFYGFINRKKSLAVFFGLTVIAVLSSFIPVITGNVEIMFALQNYIPSCVIIAAFAVCALGADNAEIVNEQTK